MQRDLKHVSNLVLYAYVVQAGGISRCAKALGMERTTISRRLRDLENALGTQLLIRSPQQLTTTIAGRQCFDKCIRLLEIVASVDNAASDMSEIQERIPLVVGAAPDVVDGFLESKLTRFERLHSDTQIQRLLLSSVSLELDATAVDLLITWEPTFTGRALVRRLTSVPQSVYASPSCIEFHGLPNRLEELRNLPCIVESSAEEGRTWMFGQKNDRQRINVRAEFVATSLLEVREAAIAGFGFCKIPEYLGEPFVQYGRLVKVLPSFMAEERTLVTATPENRIQQPRVTSLRLFLEAAFEELDTSSMPESQPAEINTTQLLNPQH